MVDRKVVVAAAVKSLPVVAELDPRNRTFMEKLHGDQPLRSRAPSEKTS